MAAKEPVAVKQRALTPALGDARKLLDASPEDSLKGIRDRAISATLLSQGKLAERAKAHAFEAVVIRILVDENEIIRSDAAAGVTLHSPHIGRSKFWRASNVSAARRLTTSISKAFSFLLCARIFCRV